MGAVKKFSKDAVTNQLRHVTRKIKYPRNVDIDKTRTHLNYSFTPERKISPRKYLKERLSQVHVRQNRNINYMSGWVITKPVDLPDRYEHEFFKACYDFMTDRYGGEKNVIAADVHKDESGEPHLHFCFVPVTQYVPPENMIRVIKYLKEHPDANNTHAAEALGISRKTIIRYRELTEEDIKYEKLSAREVLDKKELQTFHKDLQKYLDKLKIPANINSGITKAQGGNITVEQLKMQREHLRRHDAEYTRQREREFEF